MIEVIPSIALLEGKVVRTRQGDMNQLTIYDNDPIDLAMQFEAAGFSKLHLIDLDGAKKRKIVNYQILQMLTRYTKLQIDFTGGITRDTDIRTAFECGASSVMVATAAVHERERFYSWFVSYGAGKVILAADALDGLVLTKDWQRESADIKLVDHLEYYVSKGVRYVKSTEIGRDGTLSGPAFDMYRQLLEQFPDLKIYAGGGIRSLEDIEELEKIGVYAVIFGKSFYEGIISLKDFENFLLSRKEQ
ncbi:MAG TPA: 1-(5-phosphoribosyl)-5-((5-phosphoribosylamino)methylideneamino)imidazole-4-carboxamide isomerase [Microscillaceae bacterium]|nr:1-(5-phosphoribosyl)-5-((5-phosphoribosylamino)methylideneamino)imidazole-4-carboxamide isomerase [Microscillaceae bacterium]